MKTIYKKVTKRLGKIVSRVVPHNTYLRPHSVYALDPEKLYPSDREVRVHSIYPNHVTTLGITEELFNACSAYWQPKREVMTDYVVTEVPGGRIHTDNESSIAIISRFNRLVDNVSLSLTDGKVTDAGFNSIFEQRFFSEPIQVTGTVFSMLTGGAGINNICHWFLDVLPRLHLLQQSGLYDTVDWFLVPSLQYSYQTETLNLLGIPKEKLIAGDKYPHITADNIIASTAPRGSHTLVPEWVCDYIRESFLPFALADADQEEELSRHLYISRCDSRIRKVANEAKLEVELKQYDFKTIISSRLSVLEKIRIFAAADTVVSATGAGLVSLFFCKPGTKVIELFHEGFVIEPFYDIATKIGLDYSYVICKGKRKIYNATDGQREDLTVDMACITEVLRDLEKDLTPQQVAQV